MILVLSLLYRFSLILLGAYESTLSVSKHCEVFLWAELM